MLSQELKKIIKLTKKTGDRVVVYDANEPSSSFVIMDLDSYEKLIDKTPVLEEKKELKLEQKEEIIAKDSETEVKTKKELTEEDLTDKINQEISLWKNQENQSFVADDNKEEKSTKPWSIPSKVKQKAKEIE